MASTTFVDGETLIEASWLNDVNAVVYTPGTQTAADIANVPAGSITATNVQAALNELDGDIQTKQPLDATLTAVAALDTTTGLVEQTGADAFTKTPVSVFIKSLLDDADAATARATLGVSKPVIQRHRNTQGLVASTTAIIPYDNTIPQITEGGSLFSESFTPLSANSRIRITTGVQLRASAAEIVRTVAVFQAGVADALGVSADYGDIAAAGGIGLGTTTCTVDIPSPGTSAQTFEVRYGPNAASTLYVNADSSGGQVYGGAYATFVEIEEYLP